MILVGGSSLSLEDTLASGCHILIANVWWIEDYTQFAVTLSMDELIQFWNQMCAYKLLLVLIGDNRTQQNSSKRRKEWHTMISVVPLPNCSSV